MDLTWYLSIGLKALAVLVLVRRRMHELYPMLIAFLSFTTLKSLVLLAVRSNRLVYGWTWLICEYVLIAMLIGVSIEAFRRMTDGYESFTWPMVSIIAMATLVGIGAIFLIDNTPAGNYVSYTGALAAIQKYSIGGLLAVLIAAIALLPRYRTVPIRPSSNRNAACLIVYLVGTFVTSLVMQSKQTYWMASWTGMGSAIIASLGWITLMTARSNKMPLAESISDKRLRKAERRLRDFLKFQLTHN